ncbi:hypothetical protein [Lewinella sp. LCG006]|uniref:hypothetical protein n=1 Tax=Lewinella sp. LCG006 TaxID=3231911 RepID=UPI00345F6E75
MDAIAEATSLKKQLDLLRPLSKEEELRIMQKFRLDWNYHSNHLEGNTLSYGETRALILFNITAQGKPLKDHLEITGHNEAVLWILEVVKDDRPLTETFIRELHKLILKECVIPFSDDQKIEKYYDQTLTEKEIQAFVNAEIRRHTKFIQQHLDQLDKTDNAD